MPKDNNKTASVKTLGQRIDESNAHFDSGKAKTLAAVWEWLRPFSMGKSGPYANLLAPIAFTGIEGLDVDQLTPTTASRLAARHGHEARNAASRQKTLEAAFQAAVGYVSSAGGVTSALDELADQFCQRLVAEAKEADTQKKNRYPVSWGEREAIRAQLLGDHGALVKHGAAFCAFVTAALTEIDADAITTAAASGDSNKGGGTKKPAFDSII